MQTVYLPHVRFWEEQRNFWCDFAIHRATGEFDKAAILLACDWKHAWKGTSPELHERANKALWTMELLKSDARAGVPHLMACLKTYTNIYINESFFTTLSYPKEPEVDFLRAWTATKAVQLLRELAWDRKDVQDLVLKRYGCDKGHSWKRFSCDRCGKLRYEESTSVTRNLKEVVRVAIKASAIDEAQAAMGISSRDEAVLEAACAALGKTREDVERLGSDSGAYRLEEGIASKFESTREWGDARVYVVQILSRYL